MKTRRRKHASYLTFPPYFPSPPPLSPPGPARPGPTFAYRCARDGVELKGLSLLRLLLLLELEHLHLAYVLHMQLLHLLSKKRVTSHDTSQPSHITTILQKLLPRHRNNATTC